MSDKEKPVLKKDRLAEALRKNIKRRIESSKKKKLIQNTNPVI
jgi:hypothetical protein